MRIMRNNPVALGMLLLLGVAACSDLEVVNPNEADASRATQTPGDVESLVAGSFRQWWLGSEDLSGSSPFLSTASWQHSQWPANFGAVFYAQIPRNPIANDVADQYYGNVTYAWDQAYTAIFSIAEGLRAIDTDPAIGESLGAQATQRARAYGKFVQGLAHGSIALAYDQGFIVDETVEVVDEAGVFIELEPMPYGQVMEAALGFFDEAIALSQGQDFTIPAEWMSVDVDAAQLTRLAHSMKARYRAAVARNPEERAAVDWGAVLADIDAGIAETWYMDVPFGGTPWENEMFAQWSSTIGWAQASYFIVGMADQSGNYQEWLAIPPQDRLPDLPNGDPVLIVTPDLRFPRGTTLAEQSEDASAGTMYEIPSFPLSNIWNRPDRGTFRWSYYRISMLDAHREGDPMVPEIRIEEMDLLKAEALYRTGDRAGAAEVINITRTAAGLNATDASGLNTSCVPKLPNGECGDLFEMLKWEKRLETQFVGLHGAPWFFEGRGWGDLYAGTPLHFPMPCQESQIFQVACYTFGGTGGEGGSLGSVYEWPHGG